MSNNNGKKENRITEKVNERFRGVDRWPAGKVLESILDDQIAAVLAVRNALPQIEKAVNGATERLGSGKGRLIYIGAGTPARLGVLDGTELTPTFGFSKNKMGFVIAGGKQALYEAVEGAEDDEQAAEMTVQRMGIGKDDVCIAVSASGTTPFTVAACKAARKAGARTIGISSNMNAPLLQAAAFPIYLDSGAEPVGGSTRMNAGTVQGVVLKMISTTVMIGLGHVYDGMMVDMKLNNAKLRVRAERMVMDITGCSEQDAADALDASGQGKDANVKLAVLIVNGYTPEQGRELLKQQGGDLRDALANMTRGMTPN